MMNRWIFLLAALAAAQPVHAEGEPSPAAPAASAMSEGVVRKIDAANGKLTLKHGPIANLDMPAMTMVFQVQPATLLNTVKVGDKVRFRAEFSNGAYIVTVLQLQP